MVMQPVKKDVNMFWQPLMQICCSDAINNLIQPQAAIILISINLYHWDHLRKTIMSQLNQPWLNIKTHSIDHGSSLYGFLSGCESSLWRCCQPLGVALGISPWVLPSEPRNHGKNPSQWWVTCEHAPLLLVLESYCSLLTFINGHYALVEPWSAFQIWHCV
jgi:hypothetical protein